MEQMHFGICGLGPLANTEQTGSEHTTTDEKIILVKTNELFI